MKVTQITKSVMPMKKLILDFMEVALLLAIGFTMTAFLPA
jgi:hypothetical protein